MWEMHIIFGDVMGVKLNWRRMPAGQQKAHANMTYDKIVRMVNGDISKINLPMIQKACELQGVPLENVLEKLRAKGVMV